MKKREFPGRSVVKTPSSVRDPGSIPGQGIKISQATHCSQKEKKNTHKKEESERHEKEIQEQSLH